MLRIIFFTACPVSALVCSELKGEVGTVADIFTLESMDSGELIRAGSSLAKVFIFAYPDYTVCSKVTLTHFQNFMVFAKEEMNIQPSTTMDIDISPFVPLWHAESLGFLLEFH